MDLVVKKDLIIVNLIEEVALKKAE